MDLLIYVVSGLLWCWMLALWMKPTPSGVDPALYRMGLVTLAWYLPVTAILMYVFATQ